MNSYVSLAIAITGEIIATSALKATNGFSRPLPSMVVVIGWLFFKQSLDLAAFIGIGLIVAGVVILNLFSKSSAH